MAIVYAVKTGNWSDPTVWNTGALPTADDDVYSNTFTVTIDTSPTVLSISNTAATGVTAGGTFVPTNEITLTCTATRGINAFTVAFPFSCSLSSGQSCTLAFNYAANSNLGVGLVRHTGDGILNVIGSIGGGANNIDIISNQSAGTINVTGSLTGSLSTATVGNLASGTINMTGSVTGGPLGGHGIRNIASGTVNVVGNVVGGNSNATGVLQSGVGTVNIIGGVTGANGPGVSNTSTGTVTINGATTASNNAAGISSSLATAQINLTGPFITSANGTNPVYALNWRWASTAPSTYYEVRTSDTNIIRSLYTADSVGGNPDTTDVRSGTTFGPAGELTGTLAVPPAGSVALGVPVDGTTGTATIDAASIRTAIGLASANLDTQLDALPTAPENATAVWSAATRTVTGGTVDTLTNAPDVPTEVEIAAAVRTELATELGRIDVATSTRLAPDGTLATVTNLANAPDVPTPEEIAAEVRVELTPELARLSNAATTQEVGDIVEDALS